MAITYLEHIVTSVICTVPNVREIRSVQNVCEDGMAHSVNTCAAISAQNAQVLHSVRNAFLADMEPHVSYHVR